MLHRLGVGMAAFVGTLLMAAPAGGATSYHPPIIVVGANQSSNWSGYHQVSGTWVVPTATPHAPNEAEHSSSWVGIGGGCLDAQCQTTDPTLIQAGTEQDVTDTGQAQYWAWWELIPSPSVKIKHLAIHAGDTVAISITERRPYMGIWTFHIKNVSTGASWSKTLPYASTRATAEWIEETPVSVGGGGEITIGPMPNLSTVRFDNAKTNSANAHLTAAEEMQLVDGSQAIATPSAPDAQADGFNVCTYAQTCAGP
jgi:hypothetical protein